MRPILESTTNLEGRKEAFGVRRMRERDDVRGEIVVSCQLSVKRSESVSTPGGGGSARAGGWKVVTVSTFSGAVTLLAPIIVLELELVLELGFFSSEWRLFNLSSSAFAVRRSRFTVRGRGR
jgi:hypothetical protein